MGFCTSKGGDVAKTAVEQKKGMDGARVDLEQSGSRPVGNGVITLVNGLIDGYRWVFGDITLLKGDYFTPVPLKLPPQLPRLKRGQIHPKRP